MHLRLHQDMRNAIGMVLGVPWQRCTVHVLRAMLGHVQRSQQQMICAAIRQVFAAPTREEARALLVDVVVRLERSRQKPRGRSKMPKLACSRFSTFPLSTARSCARRTRSSASTVRSGDAAT